MDISTKKITIRLKQFIFIDTPGFDNPYMTDLESFTKLTNHLLKKTTIQDDITGIIYIHRAEDRIESKALTQNMRVLSDVILGKTGLSRLTILVTPDRSGNDFHKSVARALPQSSAFRLACSYRAKVVAFAPKQDTMHEILDDYVSKAPVLLAIQRKHLKNPQTDFKVQIVERFGNYEKDLPCVSVNRKIKQRLIYQQEWMNIPDVQSKEKDLKIESIETLLREKDSHISRISTACSQVEQQLANISEGAWIFQQKLQKTSSQPGSLRSQLQLQDNTEQSEIVHILKDLNRDIDSMGRSISEYLVDNYVRKIFGKDAADITALDARHLPGMKVPFDHVEGRSSLIASSSGIGMPIEDFLDYAICSLICEYLYFRIFKPFHPGVGTTDSSLVASMYEDIRLRETQAVAGKWRTDSFKSIYKPENKDVTTHHINTFTMELVQKRLEPLIMCFFGQDSGIQLDNRYLERLMQLIRTAWEWNLMLKGNLIMLGDFSITFYSPASSYDPTLMSEFEPRPRSQQPKFILGTLALGLMSSRSVGGGQAPETVVVYKAMVATKILYD